jgi:Predicted RNA-binding protein
MRNSKMNNIFEGKTEQEAIEKAIAELGLKEGDFDVEIIDSQKKGLFKKGNVKICIHMNDEADETEESDDEGTGYTIESDVEEKTIAFLTTLLEKMGFPSTVSISFRKDMKLGLNIESEYSSIIIGRKGKNLDAIQLVTNVFAGNLDPDAKVVVDSENYRMRHEEQIIRNAYKVAEQVVRSGRSKVLEPMNPFERRLVHTALNDFDGVDTKSEGEGLYKQVRILPLKDGKL